jgi:hypothetical chaperone protein
LRDELGHELAFDVERGKIAANNGDTNAKISLSEIERGLEQPVSGEILTALLSDHAKQLHIAAEDTLAMAKCTPADIDRVIYVGGSSLLSVVSGTMKTVLPEAEHTFAEVFTAVADGLARATALDR